MARFAVIGDPRSSDEPGIFSPDGTQVAVVVHRGNTALGTNDATLLLYQSADLLGTPVPKIVAEFSSATNFEPIAQVRWLEDNETLVFAGTTGGGLTQVYRVNARTRKLDALTQESAQLLTYDITPSGRHMVVITEAQWMRPEQDPACRQRGCQVTVNTIFEAERGGATSTGDVIVFDLDRGTRTVMNRPEKTDPDLQYCKNDLEGGVSQDGRFAILLCIFRLGHWPQWWLDYTADSSLTVRLKRGDPWVGMQMVLLDLEQGTSRRLIAAPSLYEQKLIWIQGGRRLVLVGALKPLAGVDPKTRSIRAATRAIVLFAPVSGRSERIAGLEAFDPVNEQLSNAWWNEKTGILKIETQLWTPKTRWMRHSCMTYRRTGGRWIMRRDPCTSTAGHDKLASHGGVQLIIEESLNDSPRLVAVDGKTNARWKVLDPNPWLAERRLGRVEEINWTSAGKIGRGGLYYPPDYVPGKRYPVLIQTHGFKPKKFSLNGAARNFIGQALAAHDVLVLQAAENDRGIAETPEEWPTVQAGYEAAISHLDELQLIDHDRVGIVGWSATGPTVGYTLTNSSYPFAAAAFTETGLNGYWFWSATSNEIQGRVMEAQFGAAPFGEGLADWLTVSPGFNFDRVRTPMLMWGAGSPALLWDWYAALKRLNVPVEYWVLPDGMHDVYKINERIHTNQPLVDWFRFWLKNEERAEPNAINQETAASLAEQYARWRGMRQQQDALLKKPRRPLLKWTATPVASNE